MKKEYKFIAVGILALLAVAFFLMKDSYLFPWEKGWKNTSYTSYGPEGYKHPNGTISVLDYGYRFVSIQERSDEKFLVWSWKMTYRNLSKKPLLVTIDFKLTDSNKSVLADNKVSSERVFQLDPGETETFSGIVESPLYAKQASSATWEYWYH